jgi:hypothetical protein
VQVAGEWSRCPLCRTRLESDERGPIDGDWYPSAAKVKRPTRPLLRFFQHLILFANILGIGASVIVNALTWNGFAWSAIVAVGCITLDVLLHIILFSHANMAARLFYMVVPVVATVIAVEYTTGTHIWHWGLDYVVPFVLVGFTTALDLLAIIRYFKWNTYSLYILILAVLGFIPLVLVATPLIHVWWPSVVAAGYSAATLVGLFIFSRRRTMDTLKRKFHL